MLTAQLASGRRHFRWLAGAIALFAAGVILILGLVLPGDDPRADPRPLSPLERKAKRMEERLASAPNDRKLQAATFEAWVEAGGTRLVGIGIGEKIPAAVPEDFEAGLRIWDRYWEQFDAKADVDSKADLDMIELAGEVSMELAEIGSSDPRKIEADVARAADTLQIAGKHRPTLYTLSNVAVFAYFNGEFPRGNVAGREAASGFKKKARRKIVMEQLDYYRGNAEVFRRLLKQTNAELRESGDELLEKPLKVYTGRTGLNKDNPAR